MCSLVSVAQDLIRKDWSCQFRHVFREANRVADALADLAFQFPLGLSVLSSPPPVVAKALLDDARGRTTPRLVVVQPFSESNE